MAKCGACGQNATGMASINGVRYCHGDETEGASAEEILRMIKEGFPPSCYEKASQSL